MSNIIDYVKWRGDLSFSNSPFNDVDGLVFSKLSYLIFDGIINPGFDQDITIRDFTNKIKEAEYGILNMLFMKSKDYENLLYLCADSVRFGGCKMYNYVNIINTSLELQFAAITFELDNGKYVVTYRGTDDTVAGWKEDFNMGIMETVPSQIESLKYLKEVASNFEEGTFYVVGHSKGGNLAVYSSIYSPISINSRIEAIYNYDGPGFIKNMDDNVTYKRLLNKIHTIVPQNSIIGMLLERKEECTVIKSNATGGFLQHYGFSWEVLGTSFVELEDRKMQSQIIDTTLKQFAVTASIDDKVKLLNALGQVFEGYESYTLTELTADKIQVINRLGKNLEGLDKETKTALTFCLRLVFREGISAVRYNSRFGKNNNNLLN